MPESRSATGTARVHLAAGHISAEGHFPGDPIIPGAVLLREIVLAIGHGPDRLREVRAAKFHRPVRPGDTLLLTWTEDSGGEVRFSCSAADPGPPSVTGSLRFSPA